MNEFEIYILIYLSSVFLASISQVLLKTSANKKYDHFIKEYLNPKVIIAYSMFFLSSLVTIYALRVIPLSMGPVLEASGYIYVAILGAVFLKEKMTKKKLLGYGCILLGILVFSS